jgi:hypothetical protein
MPSQDILKSADLSTSKIDNLSEVGIEDIGIQL